MFMEGAIGFLKLLFYLHVSLLQLVLFKLHHVSQQPSIERVIFWPNSQRFLIFKTMFYESIVDLQHCVSFCSTAKCLIVDIHGDIHGGPPFSVDHASRELPWAEDVWGRTLIKGLPCFSVVFRKETSKNGLGGITLEGERKGSGIGP